MVRDDRATAQHGAGRGVSLAQWGVGRGRALAQHGVGRKCVPGPTRDWARTCSRLTGCWALTRPDPT